MKRWKLWRRGLVLAALVAVALVLAGAARADFHIYTYGWALESSGARCGTDCTAFMQVTGNGLNWTTSGTVSSGSWNCGEGPYNFGAPYYNIPGFCPAEPNPGFNLDTGLLVCTFANQCTVYDWIRHGCGGGGFYYSPTHSLNIYGTVDQYQTWYTGTLRLGSPTHCFPGAITNAGLIAALAG